MSDIYRVFDSYDEPEERRITCKFCGEEELQWINTGARWRLYDDDMKLHRCASAPEPDDFDEC